MMQLELTDDLLTGDPDIDRQHRELFNLGNRVLFPERGGEDPREPRHALRFLASYVREHFAAEEAVMRSALLPGLERHQAEHRRFRDELHALVTQAKASGVDRAVQVRLHFLLSDWFVQHLRYWDRRLAEALREERASGREHEVPALTFLDTKRLARKGGE